MGGSGTDAVAVELAILIALGLHGALTAEAIAAHLEDPVDEVQAALRRLRDRGLVWVVPLGELEAHRTTPAAYWRLTDAGRRELSAARDG